MASFVDLALNFVEMPLEILSDVAGVISDVTGTIADVDGIIEIIEGVLIFAESAIDDIEAGLADFLDILSMITMIIAFLIFMFIIIAIIIAVGFGGSNLGRGINNHVACGSKEFDYGADNFAFTFKVMWDCFWDKFVSFWNGQCTIYYIIDIVFGIVYGVTIELPIILIRAIFGINLQPIVNDIYEMVILPLNDLVYFVTGFYIVKWDKSVTDKCFRCKGVYKMSNGKDVTLYKTFNEWAQLNECNVSQMKNGFVKIFESVIPSEKWTAWMNDTQTPNPGSQSSINGSTNWPPFY
jgi:hypothetical protein